MSFLRLYLRVLGLLGAEARTATVVALGNLAMTVAQFAEPILLGRIVDRLTGDEAAKRATRFAELVPLLASWVGFALFSIVAALFVSLLADRLAHRRRLVVMGLFFAHVLALPQSFHANVHSGRALKVMIEGANGMFSLWLSFFRENLAALISLLVLLPVTMILNWRLAGLLIVLVLVFGLLTGFVIRRTETLQHEVETHNSNLAERASDALGNVQVIQSFTQVERESRALHRIIETVLAMQLPVLSWWAFAVVGSRAAATLTLLAIFILGTLLHLDGHASIGEIVTFMNIATLLIVRLEQVIGFINALFLQAPKVRDFFEVLDTVPQVADLPGARDPGRLVGAVRFEGVAFSYDGRRDAVADLDFAAAPGDTIALVGATGSGKSTTLGLLHRIFDPRQGRILIDGIDIRDMTLDGLRRNIGVVFQEPMLFARSIEENLRMGKPDATPEEIARALTIAQAAGFVGAQPDGLATMVGERGRALSGGERQRIAIARAVLKDPPILIFDEATAALDVETERALQSALERASEGRTTFIIAHRLATVRQATRILVLDHGRVVEAGSFAELVARDGRFAALARGQFMADAKSSA
jgi:ATP-binding cassette subfamily B protein